MEENRIIESVFDGGELLDDSSYHRLFTDTQIKARSRLVDTSGEQWDIGEDGPALINFNLIEQDNSELLDQVKYLCARFVKSKSPDHTVGVFRHVYDFLNSCEVLDDEAGESLADALADEILGYFASNRKLHGEDKLSNLRLWYRLGVMFKLPMFQREVGYALRRLKLAGHIKGLDVLVHIEGKSPLTSNQLSALRRLLQDNGEHFVVGDDYYWKLAATWVFISLGVRPKQLRLLMIEDLAVNIDKETQRKTYLLNVPSVKKRHEKPRSQFKSRPIPAFLGEMLEALKNYNIQWLANNGFDVDVRAIPLFMPTTNHHFRKSGSRIALYEHCFGCGAITGAPDALLNHLNKIQAKTGMNALELKINPRRLRKTFATHAAACGTPATMLMELLDHEDMQHVMVYYKLGANFAIKINRVYREELGDLLDCFQGKISLRELADSNKNEQVFGPANLRKLVGIGFCATDGRCKLAPPYSCYTCRKFEACKDIKVHREVLDVMIDDINQLFENNVAPGKYDMEHISACRSLITQMENDQ